MENRDFVIERILSIEDFENVDKNLMEIICGDAEYRRIFDEYKEISALTKECVPEPVKNGVTLKDAVMERVRVGDVAPRFLNNGSKTRFPFATAASVAIILAVVLVSTVTTRVNDRKSAESLNFASLMDVADNGADYNYAVSSNKKTSGIASGTYMQDSVAEEEAVQGKYEIKAAPGEKSKKAKESESGGFIQDDAARVQGNFANESVKYESVYDYSDEEMPEIAVAEAASDFDREISNAVYDRLDTSAASLEISTEETAEECEEEAATVAVSPEVLARLEYANGLSVSEEKKIYPEVIEKYGEDNFIVWFDGICDSADFEKLYGIDEFIKYCENKNQ